MSVHAAGDAPHGPAAEERDRDWALLIDMLGDGACTPFLGAGACSDYLPIGSQLAAEWAQRYGYPLRDAEDLPRVAQFLVTSGVFRDVGQLKDHLVRNVIRPAALPDFNKRGQIHAALARFNLPIYVTTNYDDLMCQALWRRGREPVLGISPWYPKAQLPGLYSWAAQPPGNLPMLPDHDPSAHRPLVYHLHGHQSRPASLVLTEHDFIEYLVKLGAGLHESTPESLVRHVVREALSKSVLFVGYSLRDWSFRVLFRTLTRDLRDEYRPWGVSVQLEPPLVRRPGKDGNGSSGRPGGGSVPGGAPGSHLTGDADESAQEVDHAAMAYLDVYFKKQNITVFWGSAQRFAEELLQRTETAP